MSKDRSIEAKTQEDVFIDREDLLTQYLSDEESRSNPTKTVHSPHLTYDVNVDRDDSVESVESPHVTRVKKQTYSDLDYNSDEESAEDETTTDEEMDERNLRRSMRVIEARTNKVMTRKRRTRNGDFVSTFIENFRKYRAVIRLSNKTTRFQHERSPSL